MLCCKLGIRTIRTYLDEADCSIGEGGYAPSAHQRVCLYTQPPILYSQSRYLHPCKQPLCCGEAPGQCAQEHHLREPVLPPASLKIRPIFSMKVSSSPSPLPTRRMREAYRSNSGRDSLRRPRLTLADCAGGPGSGVASSLVSASSALPLPSTEACSSLRSLRLLVGSGPAVSSGLSTARNQALDHMCSEGLHTSRLFNSAKAESPSQQIKRPKRVLSLCISAGDVLNAPLLQSPRLQWCEWLDTDKKRRRIKYAFLFRRYKLTAWQVESWVIEDVLDWTSRC